MTECGCKTFHADCYCLCHELRIAHGALPTALQQLITAAETAAHAIPQSHYKHWDPEGQAGRCCPACIDQSEARYQLQLAIDEAKKVLASGDLT